MSILEEKQVQNFINTQQEPHSGRLINLISMNPDHMKKSDSHTVANRLHNEIIDESGIIEKQENS